MEETEDVGIVLAQALRKLSSKAEFFWGVSVAALVSGRNVNEFCWSCSSREEQRSRTVCRSSWFLLNTKLQYEVVVFGKRCWKPGRSVL